LNTYRLKTFQFLILNEKHNSTLTLWGIVFRPVTNNKKIQAVTQQNVEKVKGVLILPAGTVQ
jgi:hypothetical protein